MVYSHSPAKYQPTEKLLQWKRECQAERRRTRLRVPISCAGCPFQQLCVNTKPCKEFAFSPYLPRKILTEMAGFKLDVKSWNAIPATRKLLFSFSDGEVLSVSVGLFVNGREVYHNVKQVLLRRFPGRFTHCTSRRENVLRWRFPPKL